MSKVTFDYSKASAFISNEEVSYMEKLVADAKEQFSFRVVRMIWDCAVTVIGFAIGGVVGIVTIIMAFAIGPVAAWVSRHIQRFFEEK